MENLYDSSYKSATGTSVLSMVMRKVYGRMFLALVVTALTSLYVASSPAILSVVLGNAKIGYTRLDRTSLPLFSLSRAC